MCKVCVYPGWGEKGPVSSSSRTIGLRKWRIFRENWTDTDFVHSWKYIYIYLIVIFGNESYLNIRYGLLKQGNSVKFASCYSPFSEGHDYEMFEKETRKFRGSVLFHISIPSPRHEMWRDRSVVSSLIDKVISPGLHNRKFVYTTKPSVERVGTRARISRGSSLPLS